MRSLTSTSPELAFHRNASWGGLSGVTSHVASCPTATRPSSDTSWTALLLEVCSFSGRIVKPPRRVHTKGFRLPRGSVHCCMQLNCWASVPPSSLPWESFELRLTTLRPFGGARLPGFPPASHRTSTTRPSLRTAYP